METAQLAPLITSENQFIVAALLEAQHHHTHVRIFMPDVPTPLHSPMLGFDYYAMTLLLDGFRPPIDGDLLNKMGKSPFWLQVPYRSEYIHVCCVIQESKYDLHTLKILEWKRNPQQRWNSRVAFTRTQGPQVKIRTPDQQSINGYIRDLSIHGARIEMLGSDERQSMTQGQNLPCLIQFNEQFSLTLSSRVKQVQFTRKPCCHTHARVIFESITPTQCMQIQNFIEALADHTPTLSIGTASLPIYGKAFGV